MFIYKSFKAKRRCTFRFAYSDIPKSMLYTFIEEYTRKQCRWIVRSHILKTWVGRLHGQSTYSVSNAHHRLGKNQLKETSYKSFRVCRVFSVDIFAILACNRTDIYI